MSRNESTSVSSAAADRSGATNLWAAGAALALALTWSYWPILRALLREWLSNDDYSIGLLVLPAAVYLVWNDRRSLGKCRLSPCGWGLAVLLAALAVRAYGLLFLFESAERYSFVLAVAGLVLFVAGRQVFRQAAWILLFLFLMVPLPGRVHNEISGPLQGWATSGAVFTLELLGVTVTREGHTMMLNHNVPVAVAEACSGLRMLTAFIVVAAVFTYVIERPRWQKAVLLCSSVLVAILCNLVRLVATALLFLHVGNKAAERFFHDFAGWGMMPLAILLLACELWILSKLIVENERDPSKTPV